MQQGAEGKDEAARPESAPPRRAFSTADLRPRPPNGTPREGRGAGKDLLGNQEGRKRPFFIFGFE
jgi:hypothetical protein